MAKIDEYKNELKKLIDQGKLLLISLSKKLNAEIIIDDGVKKIGLSKYIQEKKIILPDFNNEYEKWYSESLEIIKQVLPSRFEDFKYLYKNDKRKKLDYLSYTMSDYMIDVRNTIGSEVIVDSNAALPKFQQQLKILEATERRFESTLFEIKQLLQADLFDNEIDTARELLKNGYTRAAGAVAGVVLEKHLQQVSGDHTIIINKAQPNISDYNNSLKEAQVIDVPTWRFIQHLADLRNLCDHKKQREPQPEEIEDFIIGVDKILKTVF
jgi:hypothetical protein